MEDAPLAAVAAHLDLADAEWEFIDQREMLECQLSVRLGSNIEGKLVTPSAVQELSSVSALYWRQYDFEQVLGFSASDRGGDDWRRAVAFEEAMTLFAEHAGGVTVNRPSAMGSNNSKPYQLELIRRAGFSVPETLISTEPDHVLDFWRRHGAIIYKSISSCRSIVARFGENDISTLSSITCCPTQFQQFVRGTDYRVHVVGHRAIAHRIDSAADDYRYGENTSVVSADLPAEVAERCIRVTQTMGLDFSGVDLRRSVDGEWYCFEVNPSPGFTFFDIDQRVCHAIVEHLMSSGGAITSSS